MIRQLTHRVTALLPVAVAALFLAQLTGAVGCASKLDNQNAFFNPAGGSTATTGGGGSGGSGGSGGTGGTPIGGGGTGGTPGGSGGGGGSAVCDAPNTVFNQMGDHGGCNGIACHVPNVFPPDLQTAGVAARLRGVASATCAAEKYIDTVNPANSYLLKKLQPSPMCGAAAGGMQMPFGLPPSSAQQVQCITDWVNAVAAGTVQ
ncbi:MAG TPA: hypothetical protein VL137_00005 [Polyangiaceae bacterium]|nr:hypothetical protein [Polyangiaceae bacterium]